MNLSALAAGVSLLATLVAGPANTVILNDSFTTFNTATWATCYQWQSKPCTNEWNHELEVYAPDKVRVRGGVLELTASRESRTGFLADGTPKVFEYSSGMIRQRQSFTYGYVEIEAQVPTGRGLWPALWLLPASYAWPPEIDLMENLGHEPNLFHMSVHAVGGKQEQTVLVNSLPARMHRWAVDWQPGRLTFYFDGRQTWSTTVGVPAEPMYLLANLAVGGDWPGPPDSATRFPAVFKLNSVQVWRHKP